MQLCLLRFVLCGPLLAIIILLSGINNVSEHTTAVIFFLADLFILTITLIMSFISLKLSKNFIIVSQIVTTVCTGILLTLTPSPQTHRLLLPAALHLLIPAVIIFWLINSKRLNSYFNNSDTVIDENLPESPATPPLLKLFRLVQIITLLIYIIITAMTVPDSTTASTISIVALLILTLYGLLLSIPAEKGNKTKTKIILWLTAFTAFFSKIYTDPTGTVETVLFIHAAWSLLSIILFNSSQKTRQYYRS